MVGLTIRVYCITFVICHGSTQSYVNDKNSGLFDSGFELYFRYVSQNFRTFKTPVFFWSSFNRPVMSKDRESRKGEKF